MMARIRKGQIVVEKVAVGYGWTAYVAGIGIVERAACPLRAIWKCLVTTLKATSVADRCYQKLVEKVEAQKPSVVARRLTCVGGPHDGRSYLVGPNQKHVIIPSTLNPDIEVVGRVGSSFPRLDGERYPRYVRKDDRLIFEGY